MIARGAVLFALLLFAAPAAAGAQTLSPVAPPAVAPPAEAPPSEAPPAEAPASGRVFCEQSVAFQLADRAGVPHRYRRFLGVWSDAAWDARTCAALIVENVDADGSAAIVYVYGPLGDNSPVPGGTLTGNGVIRGGALRFQNTDGTQFAFTPGIVDLDGRLTTPQGATFAATFKQTP
jgi:hypothetical protein